MGALEFILISKLWILINATKMLSRTIFPEWEFLTTDKAIFNFYNLTELHYIYICHIIWLLFLVKEPLWKYITLRNRPGGVSVSICADDRAAGDARKNILGDYYHGNLWLDLHNVARSSNFGWLTWLCMSPFNGNANTNSISAGIFSFKWDT